SSGRRSASNATPLQSAPCDCSRSRTPTSHCSSRPLPSTPSSEPLAGPRRRRRRGWLIILAGVLTVGLVAGVLVAVLGDGSESGGTMRPGSISGAEGEVGSPAPDFQLPALEGGGD